jgi:hypothetical protein
MLRPKKTIPSLVGATLAMSGCGDGGHKTTTMTGESYKAFCVKVGECYPNTSYQDDCNAYQPYADIFSAQYFSGECDALWASYFNCLAGVTCDEFTDEEDSTCYDDLDQEMIDLCDSMIPDAP